MTTMKDERLNDLIVLACEKDLTDNIDLEIVVDTWRTSRLPETAISES